MLAALCLAMVFAISLSSYIALCYTSLAMSTRNLMGEHSLELAESGIEQAIYAVNSGNTTGWSISSGGGYTTMDATMAMTASGLVSTGSNPTSFDYGNGAKGKVNIAVVYTIGSPTAIKSITSQGVVVLPTGSIGSSATPSVSRTLTYTNSVAGSSAAAPLFVNALAATSGKVTFTAAASLYSYNSNPSTGVYYTYLTAPLGFSAIIASQDITSTTATVVLDTAIVHGYVEGYDYNSPTTTNWLSYATGAKLVGYSTPLGTNIDSTRIVSTPVPYQPVFPEAGPPVGSTLPLGDTTGGNILNKTCTLGTVGATTPVVYNASGISLTTGATVSVVGPVVLNVTGAISIKSQGGIQVSGSTGSLTIYSTGGNVGIGGYGITNTSANPLPKRVALLNTNSSTYTVTISQNAAKPFNGVVYFPKQAVSITGASVICGSIVGSSISVSAAATIYYDNALRAPDSFAYDAAFAHLTAPVTVSNLTASVP